MLKSPTLRRLSSLFAAFASLGCLHASEAKIFNDNWLFSRGDHTGAEKADFDAGSWRRLDLPHDWSIELPTDKDAPDKGSAGFFPGGIAWYRKAFEIPRSWKNKHVEIHFEGVYMQAEVWLNGTKIGGHLYGFTPFRLDLSPLLNKEGRNVLCVRVDNSHQPNVRWYAGSGIYRHVWLEASDDARILPDSLFVSTKSLQPELAVLRAEIGFEQRELVEKNFRLEIDILDAQGRRILSRGEQLGIPGGGKVWLVRDLELPLPSPWSPERPTLYGAKAKLYAGSRLVDTKRISFGVRSIAVNAEQGFLLNGKSIKLIGANVHADHGPLGVASFDAAEERRVLLMKQAGFNTIRCAHNPPSSAFLAACDKHGMLVIDEFFDGWQKKKNPQDYGLYFTELWNQDLSTTVRRDRNHPSIIFWSIGNEVYERGSASGARFAADMRERIHQLDNSRPVTAALNGMGKDGDWKAVDGLFASLDVSGYNYELERHADDHARLPERVMMATESYITETFRNWDLVSKHNYIIGDFVWSGIDYLGEAGIGRVFAPDQTVVKHWEGNHHPWHGGNCGEIDITGWRKPDSYYRNIVWNLGEKLHLSVEEPTPNGKDWNLSPWSAHPALPSWTWPGSEGKTLRVRVASRHESVRLRLNGRLLGEKPTGPAEKFLAVFEVPYEAGTLSASGVDQGKETDIQTLETAGPAAGLRLSADKPVLTADGNDVVHVTVEVVDAAGRWVPLADQGIAYELTGPGSIAGIASGDLTTLETYRANPRRCWQGRALVVLRSGAKPGELSLQARAKGLSPAVLKLKSTP